jgi:hypothetical protein
MSKNHRLITSKPVGKDLVFGAKRRLGGLPVNVGGDWTPYLPDDDFQSISVETEACASFGTIHAVEILARKIFGVKENLSARYLAKISGTQHDGNDPHVVAETLRHKGVPTEEAWSNTADLDTWEKFYAEPPLSVKALALGFLQKYEFGHEYVKPDYASMLSALEYSPLGVAVWAWNGQDDKGNFTRPKGQGDDHWCVIYNRDIGKCWYVFDTYDKTHKTLAWDFGFSMVKRYTLSKAVIDETVMGLFIKLLKAILSLPNKIAFKLGFVGANLPTLQELAWGDPVAARHSARVVMDTFNLSWKEKDLLCAVIKAESGFDNNAVCKNRNEKGEVTSIDVGICQINSRYHCGEGADFPSTDYVVTHPAEVVAWMVKMYRLGHLNWWCAYQNGSYKKYL